MFLHTESSRYPYRVSTSKYQEILLIVDDDPQIRRMLMRLFKHHFNSALTAANAADFIVGGSYVVFLGTTFVGDVLR
jgi:hypothetical protein